MNDALIAAAKSAFPTDLPGITLGAVMHEGAIDPQPLVRLPLSMMTRHGLIAGATGTGKTKTLQLMAEQLSAHGVPVFLADVKGDASGIAVAGSPHAKIDERARATGYAWTAMSFPVELLSLTGKSGGQLRATISDFGPLLLSKVLGLNETQASVLSLVFRYCDDKGLLLLDLSDLREVLQYLSEDGAAELKEYGGMSKATVGVLLRNIIGLEAQGADQFFGEPAFDLNDLFSVERDGRGLVSVLALSDVQDKPALFSTFMLWMLAELYAMLPEVGDLAKPKLVFFFDEAHLLFTDAPKQLVDKIEQVVRLIRSKGVGVFFVTQNPLDVPDKVLGQLGNRVQHALRAFTPRDQKAVQAAAETMRANPKLDTVKVITELSVGEALVSFLDEKGRPTVVERAFILPPASRIGPITPAERLAVIAASPVAGIYDKIVDRESAYERLKGRAATSTSAAASGAGAAGAATGAPWPAGTAAPASAGGGMMDTIKDSLGGLMTGSSRKDSLIESMAKSAARTVGSSIGREIVRGVLGSLFGGGKKR